MTKLNIFLICLFSVVVIIYCSSVKETFTLRGQYRRSNRGFKNISKELFTSADNITNSFSETFFNR